MNWINWQPSTLCTLTTLQCTFLAIGRCSICLPPPVMFGSILFSCVMRSWQSFYFPWHFEHWNGITCRCYIAMHRNQCRGGGNRRPPVRPAGWASELEINSRRIKREELLVSSLWLPCDWKKVGYCFKRNVDYLLLLSFVVVAIRSCSL